MKAHRIFFFIAIAISSITSCKTVNTEKELQLIDSLSTEVAKAGSLLNEIDVMALKTYSDEIACQIDSVKVQFGDSMEWELAKLLNTRYAINKAFKKFIDKKGFIDEEINYSQEQLANFKHDLENNIMTLDSFKLNYTIELKALNDLKGLIHQEFININNAIEKYRETNPEMKKQMEKLDDSH